MKKIICHYITFAFTLILFTCGTANAADKRTYEGATASFHMEFTVKEGDPVDKISGKVKFKAHDDIGNFKAQYSDIFDSLVGTIKIRDRKTRAVAGNYNDETDTFILRLFLNKTKFVEVVCPRKKKASDFLTGNWIINDESNVPVTLTEALDGALTGKATGGFKGYTLEGNHEGDGTVTMALNSPDGEDDSVYLLKVCASKQTMIGKKNSTFFPNSIWCKKARLVDGDCQQDATCPAIDD